MDIELKHTWRISKRAWYIRLYVWAWGAKDTDITFCKLWWAYVFMWLALPTRLLLSMITLTQRGVVYVNSLLLRLASHSRDRLNARRQQESKLYRAPVPQPIQQPYTPLYPGQTAGEQSLIGEILRTRLRRNQRSDEHGSVTMQSLLEGITTLAAWLGIKCAAVAYAISQGARQVASAIKLVLAVLMASVIVLRTVLAKIVVKPLAYGSGGLLAFLMCTGKLLWMGMNRSLDLSLPYVERALILLGRLIWLSLWPVRKAASWVEQYLDTAGTVLAILFGVIPLFAYGGLLVWVLGRSLVLHPLLILLILGSCGAVSGLCIGMGFLLAYIMEKWFAPMLFREVLQPTLKGAEKGGETLAAGTVGFGKILQVGFKSVKSNTCPKIEVEE